MNRRSKERTQQEKLASHDRRLRKSSLKLPNDRNIRKSYKSSRSQKSHFLSTKLLTNRSLILLQEEFGRRERIEGSGTGGFEGEYGRKDAGRIAPKRAIDASRDREPIGIGFRAKRGRSGPVWGRVQ